MFLNNFELWQIVSLNIHAEHSEFHCIGVKDVSSHVINRGSKSCSATLWQWPLPDTSSTTLSQWFMYQLEPVHICSISLPYQSVMDVHCWISIVVVGNIICTERVDIYDGVIAQCACCRVTVLWYHKSRHKQCTVQKPIASGFCTTNWVGNI